MIKKIILFALVVFLNSACVTAYGPYGPTGGYTDKKIDDDTYIVSFIGNSNTPTDRVWAYWIYRCAELTKEKGFDYFTLTPIDKTSKYYDKQADELAYKFTMIDPSHLVGDADNNFIKTYTITVVTYTSRAQVDMYKHPGPRDITFMLNAQTILKELDQFIKTKGKSELMERKTLLMRAAIEAAIRRNLASKSDMDRLEL